VVGERLGRVLRKYRQDYEKASRSEKNGLLNAFCKVTGYHRKYAIGLLNQPIDSPVHKVRRRRGPTYSAAALRAIEGIWKAAGYPWSERLKALLPLWLPWARKRWRWLTPGTEVEVMQITARSGPT